MNQKIQSSIGLSIKKSAKYIFLIAFCVALTVFASLYSEYSRNVREVRDNNSFDKEILSQISESGQTGQSESKSLSSLRSKQVSKDRSAEMDMYLNAPGSATYTATSIAQMNANTAGVQGGQVAEQMPVSFEVFVSAENAQKIGVSTAGPNTKTIALRIDTKLKIGGTVYDLTKKLSDEGVLSFTQKEFDGLGYYIDSINGIKESPKNNLYWFYRVNSQRGNVGISNYIPKSGDIIRFELTNE